MDGDFGNMERQNVSVNVHEDVDVRDVNGAVHVTANVSAMFQWPFCNSSLDSSWQPPSSGTSVKEWTEIFPRKM
jgi:hypothetical protein